MSAQSPGGREVAHRVFATEFRASTQTFSRSDDERAPNYVVSPTGALMNRVFIVGVLTEVEQVNEETVRARVADPTGVFVIYASQYQPDARASIQELSPPAFVAVTGKANTFQPEGSDRPFTSLRPEAVAEVDATTRDHWVVTTAEQTLSRLGELAAATLDEEPAHEGITLSLEHYEPSPGYLSAVYETCIQALEFATGERDDVTPIDVPFDTDRDPRVEPVDLVALGRDIGPAPPPTGTSRQPDVETATRDAASSEEAIDSEIDESGKIIEDPPDEPVDDPDVFDSAGIDHDEPVVTADEREAVESEFGTEFSTGDEIESPEKPDVSAEPSGDAEEKATADESATSLSEQVMTLLAELDNGDGVPREEIVEAATDEFNVDSATINEAIRTAMMEGSCYEPAEDVLRPI